MCRLVSNETAASATSSSNSFTDRNSAANLSNSRNLSAAQHHTATTEDSCEVEDGRTQETKLDMSRAGGSGGGGDDGGDSGRDTPISITVAQEEVDSVTEALLPSTPDINSRTSASRASAISNSSGTTTTTAGLKGQKSRWWSLPQRMNSRGGGDGTPPSVKRGSTRLTMPRRSLSADGINNIQVQNSNSKTKAKLIHIY